MGNAFYHPYRPDVVQRGVISVLKGDLAANRYLSLCSIMSKQIPSRLLSSLVAGGRLP